MMTRLLRSAAVPVLGLLVMVLAGCGGAASGSGGGTEGEVASADGGPSDSAQPSGPPSATAGQADGLKFAQCMRENGVDMEDPDPNGGPNVIKVDRNNPKFAAAFEKCRQYSPIGTGERTISPEDEQRALDMAKCMRDHGINMPDPKPGQGGIRLEKGSGINPDDPKFKAAIEACKQHMPRLRDRSSASPSAR